MATAGGHTLSSIGMYCATHALNTDERLILLKPSGNGASYEAHILDDTDMLCQDVEVSRRQFISPLATKPIPRSRTLWLFGNVRLGSATAGSASSVHIRSLHVLDV